MITAKINTPSTAATYSWVNVVVAGGSYFVTEYKYI